MQIDSRHRCDTRLRHLLLPALAAALLAGTPSVQAEPAAAGTNHIAAQRVAAPLEAPPQRGQAPGNLLLMVCRRGLEDTNQMQEKQQELPLLCLATEANEETVQLGPARFRELLEKAAKSGAMVVFVLQPQ